MKTGRGLIIYLNMLAHSVTKKDNSFFRKSETWWLQVVCVQGECQLRVLDTLWFLLFKTVRHIMAISINPLRNCMFMSQNLSVYLCNAIHVYGYSFSVLTHRSRVQIKYGVFLMNSNTFSKVDFPASIFDHFFPVISSQMNAWIPYL